MGLTLLPAGGFTTFVATSATGCEDTAESFAARGFAAAF
jgi:hypothetical protein